MTQLTPRPVVRSADTIPESPRRILIAEDEHLVAVELTRCVAQMGFTPVGPVGDGDAAVTLAESAHPDLALLDVNMPGRSGLSAAKELFERLLVPVIIISAYSDEEFLKSAQSAGVFAYLVKPAHDDQVRAAIALAWSRFRDLSTARSESSDLRQRLADRRVIENAKWLLVSRRGLTEPDAMKTLQKHARDSRRGLAEVAQSLLDAESILSPKPDDR